MGKKLYFIIFVNFITTTTSFLFAVAKNQELLVRGGVIAHNSPGVDKGDMSAEAFWRRLEAWVSALLCHEETITSKDHVFQAKSINNINSQDNTQTGLKKPGTIPQGSFWHKILFIISKLKNIKNYTLLF